jgi:glycosyltransferase involved in cell wall biosynthesis
MNNNNNPTISVVICAFSLDRFDKTLESINSIINNTYKNTEIILVIDGNDKLKQRMESKFESMNNITIVGNEKNEGASISRNLGVRHAKGEIIAFIDDDGYASPGWLDHIVKDFCNHPEVDVIGGKLLPIYEDKSRQLPEEILWIVGGTYKGHPENMQTVRNVFTGNMAVRRSVFKDVSFEVMYDKKETFLYCELSHQLEDTLFCVRINNINSNSILYDPEMIAYHHVPKEKLEIRYIVKEAFFEGVLKAKLEHINRKDTLSHEHNYLNFILASIVKDFCTLDIRNGMLLLLTMSSVSIGYICYLLKGRCFGTGSS